ncbi:hypothetical protein OAD37_03610 [Gammaproteobacteria bacterium]|nr:hypothetical protein [Gammaproteobacteria bacterium]MDC1277351.1 hypothetical protein [Gammaproteobacteria bacterium]
MNLLKKIKLYLEFLVDEDQPIEYSLISDHKSPTSFDNLIIFHEYSAFSHERFKSVSENIYRCGYGAVVKAIQGCKGYKILTVAVDKKNSNMLTSIYKYFDMVIETNNIGQDFGGYFSAIKEVRRNDWTFKYITLINSSQFLSSNDLINFIEIELDENLFMGVSWGYGPKFKMNKHLHLQSFLLRYHFSSFLKIIDKNYRLDRFYSSKYNLIDKGEVELSKQSIDHGLTPVIFERNCLQYLNIKMTSFFHYDHRIKIDFDDHHYQSERKV